MPFTDILTGVRARHNLIHCITNPISIHQCANTVLAVGARPIMAEHPMEVREITETASALMLNLGNITDTRAKSISISAVAAKEKHIPMLLDAVGIACSGFRRAFLYTLLKDAVPTVIKGNYSEILALHQNSYQSSGVDADNCLTPQNMEQAAISLAHRYGAVILASGKTDIITDGRRLVRIHNGAPQLSVVTGTGCMLGALCASFLSVAPNMDAAVTACAVLGICGELAQTPDGSGSFMLRLMDALSTVTDTQITENIKLEECIFEYL